MHYTVFDTVARKDVSKPLSWHAARKLADKMGERYAVGVITCAVRGYADPTECKQYPSGCENCERA